MKTRIDIVVPEERLARNDEKKARLERFSKFKEVDRVPVRINLNPWGLLEARGKIAADYFESPEDNLVEQILNRKWMYENIDDDTPIPTESLCFLPDVGCLRGMEFEMEVIWPRDQPPKCRHPLTELEQIDSLEIPPPDGGINKIRIDWYHRMKAKAEELDVRLNGNPLKIYLTLSQPGGPIPSAFALAGSNLYLWMLMDPERTHRLMQMVTDSHIQATRFFDKMFDRPLQHSIGIGADAGEMVGPDQYREFFVPYFLKIWDIYKGPRGFHNCGKNEHLLDIIRDELNIDSHNGFGACVDPEVLAEKMSGRVCLTGGPDPWMIKTGPIERIKEECCRYIETLNRNGGYQLSTGGGVTPGTPLPHLEAMIEASKSLAG